MWVSALTHPGKKRANNQDAFVIKEFDDGCFCVVCDGMGGENGGQIASQTAVQVVTKQLMNLDAHMGENAIRRMLACAGSAANIAVFDKAAEDISLKGMGTTMVVGVIAEDLAHFIHAGDSRAYLLRDDMLSQLTTDHSVVQVLVDRGDITASEAKTHPQKNLITRAVGADEDIEFDCFSIDLQPDDAILLCSDGLYNFVSDKELVALCGVCLRAQDVSPLVNKANENGGGDNITAAILSTGRRVTRG